MRQRDSEGNMKSFQAEKCFVKILGELRRAREAYPKPFNSAHEGYAVLKEEVDELWDEVRAKQGGGRDVEAMRREAIQVGAMALRFILDVCDSGKGQL